MSPEIGKNVEKKISEVLRSIEVDQGKLNYLPLCDLSTIETRVLIEKHLISPNFAECNPTRGVALTDDHRVSVMVNEEDHLRIQVLLPGSDLEKALRIAGDIDDKLEQNIDIAYKENFGYLTSCPTNVGTGLRVSVMMHLPALVINGEIQQVIGALTHVGLAVRGMFGEGSRAIGNVFQISNQVTLGKSEEDTLTHLKAVSGQIVEREMQARKILESEALLNLEDKVWRARGILKNARLLTSEETISLLSQDRIGIDMGIVPEIKAGFAALLVNSLHGCLQYRINKPLDVDGANFERARFIRELFEL